MSEFHPEDYDCPFHVDQIPDAPCICDGPPEFPFHVIVQGEVVDS